VCAAPKSKEWVNALEKELIRLLFFGSTCTETHMKPIAIGLLPFAAIKVVMLEDKRTKFGPNHIHLCMIYRLFESIFWTLLIFKNIKKFGANIIMKQYTFHYGLIAGVAAKLARIPSVVQVIGSDLKVEALRSWLNLITIRLILRITSGLICVSRDLENIARSLGARNTTVIPTPLDLSYFPDRVRVNKKTKEIISIANIIPLKGLFYLVKAMKFVQDGTLLIIGDGPERKRLEMLLTDLGLTDRVFFLGRVDDRSRLWDYLHQATVFVLPSLSEGCPRVILEAMACGLPIIATNVGGIPEILTDGVNGLLVTPRDEKALANAIKKILNDKDFQKSASIKNREAAKEYSLQIICQRIYSYLKEIVSSNLTKNLVN
jgi:glycosyltransferase involved in cell wall biosynthesis